MMDKKQFAVFAKRLLRRTRGVQDPQIMHPNREWLIGLAAMVVVFVGSAYWSTQVYLANKQVTANSADTNSSEVPVYREQLVKGVLETMAKRQQTLDSLVGTAPVPPPVETIVATSSSEIASSSETLAPLQEEPEPEAPIIDSAEPGVPTSSL